MKINLKPQKFGQELKYMKMVKSHPSSFLTLKRKNAAQKVWIRIKCQDGTYSSDINVILNEQKQFYKKLFTSEGSDQQEANIILENLIKL